MNKEYSKQEIFDRVVKHAESMTRPSVDPTTDRCVYRSPDGGMCLVGALIQNSDYLPEMEQEEDIDSYSYGSSVLDLCERNILPEYLKPHISLLGHCQSAHDDHNTYPVEKWKELMIQELKKISSDYDLQYNGLL